MALPELTFVSIWISFSELIYASGLEDGVVAKGECVILLWHIYETKKHP